MLFMRMYTVYSYMMLSGAYYCRGLKNMRIDP